MATLGNTKPLPPLLVIISTLTSTFPFTSDTLTGIQLRVVQTAYLIYASVLLSFVLQLLFCVDKDSVQQQPTVRAN